MTEISENSYFIFKNLSPFRKIEFCLEYLNVQNEVEAMQTILKEITIPKGSQNQRILSIRDKMGNSIEVVSNYDDLHFQSNSEISINTAIQTLFLFGEILFRISPPEKNKKVYEYQKTYRRISRPGEYYPINLN